ncbi:hypothetical protein D3C86_1758670 [compost metagenome]
MALARAIKMAAMIAVPYPSTDTPGTRRAPIKTTSPMSKISIISFIMINLVI